MIQWCFDFLRSQEGLNCLILARLGEIMMNLMARTQGRKIAQNPKLGALKLLIPLLTVSNCEICSYINGCIYSLLDSKEMQAEAKVTQSILNRNLDY